MDLIVRQLSDSTWIMSDLLGRSAGSVEQTADGKFRVVPAGQAVEKLRFMSAGPFASLHAALAAVETQTRGTCRIEEGSNVPDIAETLEPETADVIEMPTRGGDA